MTFGLTNRVREAWDANGTVDKESGAYVAGQVTGVVASTALGVGTASAIRNGSTLATSGPVRAIATEVLSSKPGQALFGKGGVLNSGQTLRMGVSRAKDGGRFVLRVAGTFVERVAGTKKIDLIDLGKISDFISALGR